MPNKDYQSKRDEILRQFATSADTDFDIEIRYGRTFEESQVAIDQLVSSERQKEREIVIDELLAAGMKMTFPNRRGIYILWWPDGFWDILLAAKRQQPSKKEQ